MASRNRNTKPAAPVRFAIDDMEDDLLGTQDGGDDNMLDMLTIMQEYQRMKALKSTSRTNALQTKKNAIVASARKDAETLVRTGTQYFEQVKAKIVELQAQEARSGGTLKEVATLWSAHEDSMRTLLSIFPSLIEELSPRRARDINSASEMLETHPKARDMSRKRLMRTAKKNLEAGLENQKLVTDASSLIKHYKALLLL